MSLRCTRHIALLAAFGFIYGLSGIAWAEEKSPLRLEARALNRSIENQENPALINVSGYLSCMDARIAGSVCMSCDGDIGHQDIFPSKKDTKLVFYHVSPAWESDCRIITEAQRRGYTRIYILKGGLPAWRKAGYDTESVQRTPRTPGLAIKPEGVAAWRKSAPKPLVLDIRPTEDFKRQHIEGAVNIPFSLLHLRYPEIPWEKSLLIVDEDGGQSFLAASYLSRKGFGGVVRLGGGMAEWNEHVGKGLTK